MSVATFDRVANQSGAVTRGRVVLTATALGVVLLFAGAVRMGQDALAAETRAGLAEATIASLGGPVIVPEPGKDALLAMAN